MSNFHSSSGSGGLPGGFLNPEPSGPDSQTSPAPQVSSESSQKLTRLCVAYMTACGESPERIALESGLSFLRISGLMNDREVLDLVKKVKDENFGGNIKKRIARSVPKALKAFEDIIEGNVPAKTGEMLSAAQWMLEKYDGKPQQTTTVDAGGGLMQMFALLDQQKEQKALGSAGSDGSAGSRIIDVTPSPQERDPMQDFVDQFVPVLSNEKSSGGKE